MLTGRLPKPALFAPSTHATTNLPASYRAGGIPMQAPRRIIENRARRRLLATRSPPGENGGAHAGVMVRGRHLARRGDEHE